MTANNVLIHVIEDDFVFGKMIKHILNQKGYQNVKIFKSGKNYLDNQGYRDKPDIALIDYYLDHQVTGNEVEKVIEGASDSTHTVLMSSKASNGRNDHYHGLNNELILPKSLMFKENLTSLISKLSKSVENEKAERNAKIALSVFAVYLTTITSLAVYFFS